MKNSNINQKQNKQIALLNQKVAQLKMLAAMPKKAKRVVAKRLRKTTPRLTNDPVVACVKAMVDPFNAPKGSASYLGDGRPSQKFMAKANTSVSVPAGCYMVFMAAPCLASNSEQASMVMAVQTTSTTPLSGPWKNAVVGTNVLSGGTVTKLSTNTPYTSQTLDSMGTVGHCVGVGYRFTYEGAELYKSGTFKYIHDNEGFFNSQNGVLNGDWSVANSGPAGVISYVDSATNSIRQSINKNNIVEVNGHIEFGQFSSGNWYGGVPPALIGGTTATTQFAIRPGLLGYFLNSSTASISFHIETVEHYSVSADEIQSLQTESTAHPVLYNQVRTLMRNSRQLHASKPNADHISMLKTCQKAAGSKLGHEVLETAISAALA
jgi:hypothetical protein